jgi:hypothetical protein
MIISWLESTTAPFGQYWTSSSKAEVTGTSLNYTNNDETVSYTDTIIDSFSLSQNYSGTTKSFYFSGPGVSTIYEGGSAYTRRQQSTVSITVIGSVDSSEGGWNDNYTSYSRRQTILSTRAKETSTTNTYQWGLGTQTRSVGASKVRWTTARADSLISFQSNAVFTTSSKYFIGNLVDADSRTKESATTIGTEVVYGYDNTVYQCDTSRGDYLSEGIALEVWTAPNSFTLSQDDISAFTNAAVTASRWTESYNVATMLASSASTALGYGQNSTIQLSELTSSISYTTTTLQTTALQSEKSAFPIETQSSQGFCAPTTTASALLTYYEAQTITTARGIDHPVAMVALLPTLTTKEWFNKTTTYTTGNGQETWHELTDQPETRTRTTQHATASVSGQTPVALAPVLLYVPSITWNGTDGDSYTQAAGVSMTCSAYNSAGVAVGLNEATPDVSWFAYGESGSQINQNNAGLVDLQLGKSFVRPAGLTAFAGRRADLLKTVFPSTYTIEDAPSRQWTGLLSVHGKSASATFVPTNTNQSISTTEGEFSTLFAQTTVLASSRTGLIGGKPASGETFFEHWPRAIFANETGETLSANAHVASQTETSATTYLKPIVGVFPATYTQSRTVVSFSQPRNITSLLF